MAKANKKSKAQRQAELAEKLMGKRHADADVMEQEVDRGDPPTEPQGTYDEREGQGDPEVVELPPTPEGIAIIEQALAEAPAAEAEDEEPKPSSVVKPVFKQRYAENAREQGVKGKAAKRSNWDWLAQRIAEFTLTDKHSIRMDDFVALLDANGVDHSKWTNKNRGWEGRFRMTGRVALQRIVATNGVLKYPDGSEMNAPMDFILKYKAK